MNIYSTMQNNIHAVSLQQYVSSRAVKWTC